MGSILKICKSNNSFNINTNCKLSINGCSVIDEYNVNASYPIGSIYINVNNVSPASLFGGIWEQIAENINLPLGDYADVVLSNIGLPNGYNFPSGADLNKSTPIGWYSASSNYAYATNGVYVKQINTPDTAFSYRTKLSTADTTIKVYLWKRIS